MNTALSRATIAVAALLFSSQFAIARFVLITEEEARRPRLFMGRGPSPPPIIEVFGLQADVPAALPLSFVVRFSARGGASVNMDSVRVTYMVKDPVDLTGRVRPFMTKQEIRVTDAIVPPGKHQIRISVQDSNGESRHTYHTFCVSYCDESAQPGDAAPLR